MLLPKRKVNWKLINERLSKYEQELNKKVPVELDDKVDEFIKRYTQNLKREDYFKNEVFNMPRHLRDVIEKMAVWYELRYPSYEINRMMPCMEQENTSVSEVMFQKNPYVDNFELEFLMENLDWDKFYNTNAFLNSLPRDERWIFEDPKYPEIVYLDRNLYFGHFHLDANGIIEVAEVIALHVKNEKITDSYFEGMHILEACKKLQEFGVEIPENGELGKFLKYKEERERLREEFLNCVMYRIIERGGNRVGPRRALLFAKEFKRNIDIPMMYGVDLADPGLRLFANEYLMAGGSPDLECFVGYGLRESKDEKLDSITVGKIIKTKGYGEDFYTSEEKELHQRLVEVLGSQVDYEKPEEERSNKRKEEVRQLRLERKLKNARRLPKN